MTTNCREHQFESAEGNNAPGWRWNLQRNAYEWWDGTRYTARARWNGSSWSYVYFPSGQSESRPVSPRRRALSRETRGRDLLILLLLFVLGLGGCPPLVRYLDRAAREDEAQIVQELTVKGYAECRNYFFDVWRSESPAASVVQFPPIDDVEVSAGGFDYIGQGWVEVEEFGVSKSVHFKCRVGFYFRDEKIRWLMEVDGVVLDQVPLPTEETVIEE